MAEMHFGNSAALTDVIYNGTSLDKVYYNNVLVFKKIHTATETVSFQYKVNGNQSGASFYIETLPQTISLSHSPGRVTSISGGINNTKFTINSDESSGTMKFPKDSSTASSGSGNWYELNWVITGGNLVINGTKSSGGTQLTTTNITISYEY